MRRLALVVLLLTIWILAGCESTPAPPAAVAPTTTPPETITRRPIPSPTSTLEPGPTPSVTHSPSPTAKSTLPPTRSPTCTPLPSPTPTPTLPPLRTPETGDLLSFSLGWRFSADGHLTAGSIVHLSGQSTILLSSLGRTVYALTAGGEVRWRARTSGPVYALAILEGDRVAVGDDAGFVTLLDAEGQWLWRHNLGSRVTALSGEWQGGLLAGGWDQRLTYLSADGADSHVIWQASLGSQVSDIAVLPDLVLAATLDGVVYAFDPDGGEVWRFDASAPVTRLGVVGDEDNTAVLVGLQDGRLLALDDGGTVRWQQTLGVGGPIWHFADLVDDAAPEIVAGTGGAEPAVALLSTSGEVLWRVAVPSPVGAVTTLDLDGDGRLEVLVGLASGEIQAYDGGSRLRGSVHAGLSVWGLEVAETGSAEGVPSAAEGPAPGGSALVLADVVAWQLSGSAGSAGSPWLPPPEMIPTLPGSLPPGTERAEGEAILVFLGDVALGRSMEAQLARYGPAYPWTGLGPLLRESDLAVANLEGVLTTQGKPLNKPYLLRAHPRWGQTLVEAGLDLVTLANNHALDYGDVGLDETLASLEALDVATVGGGRSRDEAQRRALFNVNGVRVAVLGYAASRWNGSVDVPATERIAWAYAADVQAGVRAAHDQADFVVVVLHAGTEYAAEPSADQVTVAHAAVDAGADLVVGHHPHVTQTIERYKQGLIVYSLGDALFDIPRQAAMRGDLLRVHVTREGLIQAELWPFWIEDAICPQLLDDGQGVPRFRIIHP